MIGSIQNTTTVRTAPAVKANAPQATAAAGLAQDQLAIAGREAKLAKTPALVQTDYEGLLDFFKTGKIAEGTKVDRNGWDSYRRGGSSVRLGNVSGYSDNKDGIAILLSDEGKKQLAKGGDKGFDRSLDQILAGKGDGYYGGMGSKSIDLNPTLDPAAHVKQILVNEGDFDKLVKEYAESVQAGKLPAEIAGKPYAEYLEKFVTKTDDLYANLEVEAFRLQVPGFEKLPEFAHRPAASLAGRVAASYPDSIPADLRRQVAFSKVSYQNFAWNNPIPFLGKDHNVREFHHGTTMKWMAYTNFKGDLETAFKSLSEENQTRVNDFVKQRTGKDIRFVSVYGPGVYTGNASVASGYAHNKLNKNEGGNPVHVISGLMDVGNETLEDLDQAMKKDPKVHTRIVPDGGSEGAYRVTRGSKHFKIKGVTTFDPKAADPRAIPMLIEASKFDSRWAAEELGQFDAGKVRRALEHHATKGDEGMRKAAQSLLEQMGKQAPKTESTAKSSMMAALKKGFSRIL